MDDVKKDQPTVSVPVPGSPGRASKEVETGASGSSSPESQALSEARAALRIEGPEAPVKVSEGLKAVGVEQVTSPVVPVQGAQVQVEVPEPSLRPETLSQAQTMLSKIGDILSSFRNFLLVSIRQFKKQLRAQPSNP